MCANDVRCELCRCSYAQSAVASRLRCIVVMVIVMVVMVEKASPIMRHSGLSTGSGGSEVMRGRKVNAEAEGQSGGVRVKARQTVLAAVTC